MADAVIAAAYVIGIILVNLWWGSRNTRPEDRSPTHDLDGIIMSIAWPAILVFAVVVLLPVVTLKRLQKWGSEWTSAR